MNLFFGSVLATISLTVSVVTLIAFMTGNELQFALGAPEMVVMVASLVLYMPCPSPPDVLTCSMAQRISHCLPPVR